MIYTQKCVSANESMSEVFTLKQMDPLGETHDTRSSRNANAKYNNTTPLYVISPAGLEP